MNAANETFVAADVVPQLLHFASQDGNVVRLLVQENQLVMDCSMELYRWQLSIKITNKCYIRLLCTITKKNLKKVIVYIRPLMSYCTDDVC